MRRGFILGGENAGAFERDVDAERLVRQLRRVLDRGDLDRPHATIDAVAGDLHFAREAAMHRVEAQQMRIGLDRSQVVDRHDLDILPLGFHNRAQDVAPDAAEPVDGNPDGHSATFRAFTLLDGSHGAVCGSGFMNAPQP